MRKLFIAAWVSGQQRSFHQTTRKIITTEERHALETEAEAAIIEIERKAAEKAWNQAVGRTLQITQADYFIGDGLLTVIGNPYTAEAYRQERKE